jgi:hypothetical protein
VVTCACDTIPSNCDSAIWTTFIEMNDNILTKGKLYRLTTDSLQLSLNAAVDRGLKEGYALRENRVIGYIDSSSDSLTIINDGATDDPITQKESYWYWLYFTIEVDSIIQKGDLTDTVQVERLDSAWNFYNEISFGYYMDSTNMYRYVVYGDFSMSCTMDHSGVSNELSITIVPDDSIHTIIKVYATIEEGYGHLNDLSVREPITFLIDNRP